MGHFGHQSDANDTAWDILGHCATEDEKEGENVGFPTTQEQADRVTAYIATGFPDESGQILWAKADESDTVLGPVVYLLREGLSVPTTLLVRARDIANARLADSAYLDCWRERETRMAALQDEIGLIERALATTAEVRA